MTELSRHGEWLSLIDITGPFLAEPVLKDAFPQGLEGLDSAKRRTVRQAYDEWREALDLDDPDFPKIHRAWIDLVLKRVLELDEDGNGDILKSAAKLPSTIRCELPEHGISLRPDYAVMSGQADSRPLMLIAVYGSEVSLTESLKGDGWVANPAERMVELCRATDVRLGLATNGEQWTFVDAPIGAVTSFASWYAKHWGPEPVTLQAFVNLLGVRRFFVDRSEQLPALLDNSLKFQDAVTDALGEQVRRAVEVLIQALDRADVDRNRELLDGVEPAELYEAGLTVMMRIVFLLSAEERGLLLLGDERYEANYAVSTLRMQLRRESEEILERRWDAWSRLLSIFRAVYGGIDHESMRLPALGGSLFDPDRFPFLEGRAKGSHWKIDPATPLPIDNRTVLYLLDSVQLFQGRTLSYLALDIEQIGYVYEGLLERTVVRAKEATLDLDATKNAKNPWVSLAELDDAAAQGRQAVEELLKDRTGSSASRIRNDLDRAVDEGSADKLLTSCHADRSLRDRIRPYFHFLRTDRWGYPIVYPKGAFMVTTGTDRRETGTHYTPKSLTEAIVKETLEPLVYVGPAAGNLREDWKLKSPAELLDLKICDPAMGSGAFLVQACRWLAERLVESWRETEKQGNAITAEGEVVDEIGSREPMRRDIEERLLTARRLIVERCLYGVDVNPLAVELAKLSIWLVTLAKGRPFGFLDHNLRCGDSLLGIHNFDQLYELEMETHKSLSKKLFAQRVEGFVKEAVNLRSELRRCPIREIRDVEKMASLNAQSKDVLETATQVADCLAAEYFMRGSDPDQLLTALKMLSVDSEGVFSGEAEARQRLNERRHKSLRFDPPKGKSTHIPFHWPLEFPEVFASQTPGFDAMIGNPPFLWALRISIRISVTYGHFLKRCWPHAKKNADLCSYFLLRAADLLKSYGVLGFVTTNTISEADTRETCLDELDRREFQIINARSDLIWPGNASLHIATVVLSRGIWAGARILDSESVDFISTRLNSSHINFKAAVLAENRSVCFKGSVPLGDGFFIEEAEVQRLLNKDQKYKEVLFQYLNGQELNSSPTQRAGRWVIYFRDWPLERCRDYPECLKIVEEHVKPERDRIVPKNNMAKQRKELWWKFTGPTVDLYGAIARVNRVLVASAVSKHHAFVFVPSNYIYSNALNVFATEKWQVFAVLQSTIHSIWALENGSKLESRPRYNVSDCFETFPFPKVADTSLLAQIGEKYHQARAKVMHVDGIGLTDFYNRFHQAESVDERIAELRTYHRRMDELVVEAFGWSDLPLHHGLYELRHLPQNDRVRFRVSEDAKTELVARLFQLNGRRFRSETASLSSPTKEKRDPSSLFESLA